MEAEGLIVLWRKSGKVAHQTRRNYPRQRLGVLRGEIG